VSQPQPAEGVSHAPKIRKQDGLLDWTQPAAQLWNRIRAFTPRPGAFTHLPPAGTRLKVWKAEVVSQSGPPGRILGCDRSGLTVGCGRDALRITRLQLEGGRALDMQEFIAGHAVAAGQSLR
jgi:methionyl-tRNA formyltransferase